MGNPLYLRRLAGDVLLLADQPILGERIGADDALERVAEDVWVGAGVLWLEEA